MPILPLFAVKDIDKYFYNRNQEINTINSYFNSNSTEFQQLIINGNRGMGKTFLIKKILNSYNDEYLTIYLDLAKISNSEEILTEEILLKNLFYLIGDELVEKTKNSKISQEIKALLKMVQLDEEYDFREVCQSLDIPIPVNFSDLEKLNKFAFEFPQKIANKFDEISGFIIAIDEFQLIKELDNPEEFFSQIRLYNKFQDDVFYIFSSLDFNFINADFDDDFDDLFESQMIKINLRPFTIEETKTYFDDFIPEIKFTEDGFERFYFWTKGIPVCINSFANLLSSEKTYDENLINETFNLKTDQILVKRMDVWANLNKVEKNNIVAIIENEGLNKEFLINDLAFSRSTIIKYLDILEEKMIIESTVNNNYIVSDEMFKRLLLFKKDTLDYIPI